MIEARLVRIPDAPQPPEAWTLMAGIIARTVRAYSSQAYQAVVEFPRTYGGRASRGSTDDLLSLAALVGTIAAWFNTSRIVQPQEWKGGTPKKISMKRTIEHLSEAELDLIDWTDCPASLRHNVWDAVGIGLFAFRKDRPRFTPT